MGTPITCLLVEDSEVDAELLIEALRRGGYAPIYKRVQTAETMREALRQQSWDVVFCDYVMPQFDAMSAFLVLRTSDCRIPFIIVSGEIGEDRAVEALKFGADDYVLKHNLKRLIPALRRALKDAENRNQRDAALRTTELIMSNSLDMICTVDEQSHFVEISAAVKRILGYEAAELIGRNFSEFMHPDDRNRSGGETVDVMAGHETFNFQSRFQHKDGTWVHLMWSNYWSAADNLFFCVVRDVTKYMQAQESLQVFRNLVDQSGDVFEVVDPETGRFLDISERGCLDLGYSREELLSLSVPDIDPNVTKAFWSERAAELKAASSTRIESIHRRKDGTTFPVEVNLKFARLNRDYLIAVVRNITERRHSEARIREQAQLLDKASDAIIVRDINQVVRIWSKGAERIYGWAADEVVGRDMTHLILNGMDTHHEAMTALHQKGEWIGELQQIRKDGTFITVQCRWTLLRNEQGEPQSILSINTDVTEQKKLEAQFLRAQRMESIGTLASGIAHDLNNVLAPILMSLGVLKEKLNDQESQNLLDNLETNVKRGSSIVNQVLAFGRGMCGERVPVNLKHLLKEIGQIINETFPKKIRLETKTDSDLWNVTGDPTQLHQVLLNLCVNARDAMPQGGFLTLSLQNLVLDKSHPAFVSGESSGDYVLLEVSDTGQGIPAEIRDRIFEPFFTTKEIGQGTGLGLSTVTGILKSHGGFIKVDSQVNKGTTFKIYLPATSQSAAELPKSKPAQLPRGNGEYILVVDDEQLILDLAQKALERFGYKVITAPNGAVAVALYTQHQNEIAAVITDMAMPVMDGMGTIHALLKINPLVRIIAMSGFKSGNNLAKAAESSVHYFLKKPYTIETLLNMLHQLLHETESQNEWSKSRQSIFGDDETVMTNDRA